MACSATMANIGQFRTFEYGTEFMFQTLKMLFVVLLASVGDMSFVRSFICVIGGFCVVGLVYWVASPHEWPLWPAVVAILLSGALGLLWEDHASTNSSKR